MDKKKHLPLLLAGLAGIVILGVILQSDLEGEGVEPNYRTVEESFSIYDEGVEGATVQVKADGTKIITTRDTTVIEVKPDGSKIIKNADGSTIEKKTDGSKIIKKSDGTIVQIKADGSKVIKKSDGTTIDEKAGH